MGTTPMFSPTVESSNLSTKRLTNTTLLMKPINTLELALGGEGEGGTMVVFSTLNYKQQHFSFHGFYSIAILMIFFFISISSTYAATYAPTKTTASTLANKFLAPHNALRSALRIPLLVWDTRLASYAQSYANKRRGDCALRHSNGPYGENIFWGGGSGWTPGQAVTAWVSEKKWYNYYSNSCYWGQQCGHYTQIAWRGTKRLGCATVNCNYGLGVFIICSYDPPGNWMGEKPY